MKTPNDSGARYTLTGSPLFHIPSMRRLGEVLQIDVATLKQLQRLGSSAYVDRISPGKNGKKPRKVQDPIPQLKIIQKRLNRLMQRVIHPSYIQAGLRNRSYIKNASEHSAVSRVCKIDIQSFYPSCRREKVYQLFVKYCDCAPDVAKMLADLTTVNGHLPTGGPFSLLLSFWAYKEVFDKIQNEARKAGLVMTVYVDDLTFSGERATKRFLNDRVRPILCVAGLIGHKIEAFEPNVPKPITGVLQTGQGTDGLKVPFSRCQKIHVEYLLLYKATSPIAKLECMTRLISRLCEAAQIDSSFQSKADAILSCRRELMRRYPQLRNIQTRRSVLRQRRDMKGRQKIIASQFNKTIITAAPSSMSVSY